MSDSVLRFRLPYWGVVPGPVPEPGQDERQPVGYEKTLDGFSSAVALARHLSVGGPAQDVVLVRGKHVQVRARFEHGIEVTGLLALPAGFSPASVTELRPGSPKGHIDEICTHKQHVTSGRQPRRSRNMPRTPSYATTLAQIQASLDQAQTRTIQEQEN